MPSKKGRFLFSYPGHAPAKHQLMAELAKAQNPAVFARDEANAGTVKLGRLTIPFCVARVHGNLDIQGQAHLNEYGLLGRSPAHVERTTFVMNLV